MRVTVDCQGLQSANSINRGIGNYCFDFLNSLLNFTDQVEITFLVNEKLPNDRIHELISNHPNGPKVSIRNWNPLAGSSWISGNFDSREISENIYSEVVLSTQPDKFILLSAFEGLDEDVCWKIPTGVCAEAVYYDAIPRIYSERYLASPHVKKWYESIERKLEKFHRIYAISDSSAADGLRFLGVSKDRIKTIHFGISVEDIKRKSGAIVENSKTVLAVLGEDERKNKENLLKAWIILRDQNLDLKLKIVYKQSSPEKLNNEKYLRVNKIENLVEFVGYVSQRELDNLYDECVFTIFPSFYEGLGLPVLESFRANKACLVADTSSLKELISLQELKFNPSEPDLIARAIENLYSDKNLQRIALRESKVVLEKFSDMSKLAQIGHILSVDCDCKKETFASGKEHILSGIYFHTILKPTKSGIANFADNLIHAFHEKAKLKIVSNVFEKDSYKCPECNTLIEILSPEEYKQNRISAYIDIHNLGNSSYHIWQFDLIGQFPGAILLHDGYLSGLVWAQCQSQSDEKTFISKAIRDSCSLNFLDSRFLLEPHLLIEKEKLNSYFVESACSVIVHNAAARNQILSDYAIADPKFICVTPLPVVVSDLVKDDIPKSNVIGVFGIIAETKMYAEIMEAWANTEVAKRETHILRFIGENLTTEFDQLCEKYAKKFRIEKTGFLTDNEYRKQITEVQFAIQMRRDFRGETSGAIVDLLASGVPVIANIQASLESYPNESIALVPSKFSTKELSNKIDSVIEGIDIAVEKAKIAQKYIMDNANPKKCAEQIIETALLSRTSRDFFPINQAMKHLKFARSQNFSDMQITDLVDSCLESFPLTFTQKRIIVVVNKAAKTKSETFARTLLELKNKLAGNELPPIFFCETIPGENNFKTVNSKFFDKRIQEVIGEVDFKIRIRKSDFVLRGQDSSLSTDLSRVFHVIQSELKGFLQND